MAKKFIEFLEAAALIILTGVIVVGVIKYIDSKEPKEETPLVEENQGLEEVTIKLQGSGYEFTFNYEDGMTWAEVAEINDNIQVKDGYITFCLEQSEEFYYLIACTSPEDRSPVTVDSEVDLTLLYVLDDSLD